MSDTSEIAEGIWSIAHHLLGISRNQSSKLTPGDCQGLLLSFIMLQRMNLLDFRKLSSTPANIEEEILGRLDSTNPEIQSILQGLTFADQVKELSDGRLLAETVQSFANIGLSAENISADSTAQVIDDVLQHFSRHEGLLHESVV